MKAGYISAFRQWYIIQHWSGLEGNVQPKPICYVDFIFDLYGDLFYGLGWYDIEEFKDYKKDFDKVASIVNTCFDEQKRGNRAEIKQ